MWGILFAEHDVSKPASFIPVPEGVDALAGILREEKMSGPHHDGHLSKPEE
jgi:hypothetical protein